MTMVRLHSGLLAALALTALASAPQARSEPVPGALVRVLVTYQQADPFLPWQYQAPGMKSGYGVAVASNLILTTENLVRSAKLVELQQPRAGEKTKADVLISDPQVNLALLRIADRAAITSLVPAEVAERAERETPLAILQINETGEQQSGAGRILQVAMNDLPSSPYACLSATVISDLNVNGEGAPALQNNKLAGLIITYDASSRTGILIPAPILTRFLADAQNPPYEGFASAGFTWAPLIDPAKRAYLGVPKDRDGRGILVLSCLPGTGARESLKPNDVILEWDGFPLDNMGFYEDPEYGRMQMSQLIKGRRKPGETVPVSLIRDGRPLNVNVRLCRWDDRQNLIPENFSGEPVPFLVDGGYVLMELTGRYLRAHGANWERVVDPRLTQKYLFERHLPETPGQHVVILAGVLPDPSNIGFHEIRNAIVTAVNGKPVANMDDVFAIVDGDGGLRRITLKSVGVDVVVDQDARQAVNARLAAQYRIPVLRYRRDTPPQK